MHSNHRQRVGGELQIDARRRRVDVIALRGRRRSACAAPAAPASSPAAQKMPTAIWVVRQPAVCTPQLTSGGQIAPPT